MRYLVCVVLFSLGSVPVSGQDTRGTISGTVTDPQGGVLPGATVVVSNTGTGTASRLTTNSNLELRGDFINLQNRSQWNPPELSPTSTNFGRITSQTASLNRFIQVQARLLF